MTTAVKVKAPKPPEQRIRPRRGKLSRAARARRLHAAREAAPYAASIAAAAAAAAILRQPDVAFLGLGTAGGVALTRLHDAAGWHRSGGKAAMRKRRRYQGTATRREIRRNLSPEAVRKRAAITCPGLHPSQAAVVIAQAKGHDLAGSREDSYLLIAGPRMGKTALLSCWAAGAPGALLATSTRTDLYAHTAIPRGRLGEIMVLNPGGDGGIPSGLEWSPLDGCHDPAIAIERAGYLMAAAPKDSSGKDAWWDAKGGELLRLMLHAAAICGATMREACAWIRDPASREPASVLAGQFAAPGWEHKLAMMTGDQSDQLRGITASAEAAVSWMDDPAMARAACPAGTGFDAAAFTRDGTGTVYLIAADKPHGTVAPYFAAFAANLFETAKYLASHQPGGRLEYPLSFALDEAAITCPVPLHRWMSEAGGHGVTVQAAVQAVTQLKSRWGEHDGMTIFKNATVKVFWGGDTACDDLEAVSAVCGMRDTWDHVTGPDGSKTRQPRQERAIPPERIRMLGENQVLVLHRSTRPVIARVTPVWQRPGYEPAPLGPSAFPPPPQVPPPAIAAPRREAIPAPPAPPGRPARPRTRTGRPGSRPLRRKPVFRDHKRVTWRQRRLIRHLSRSKHASVQDAAAHELHRSMRHSHGLKPPKAPSISSHGTWRPLTRKAKTLLARLRGARQWNVKKNIIAELAREMARGRRLADRARERARAVAGRIRAGYARSERGARATGRGARRAWNAARPHVSRAQERLLARAERKQGERETGKRKPAPGTRIRGTLHAPQVQDRTPSAPQGRASRRGKWGSRAALIRNGPHSSDRRGQEIRARRDRAARLEGEAALARAQGQDGYARTREGQAAQERGRLAQIARERRQSKPAPSPRPPRTPRTRLARTR